jgi:hypothetical protein
MKTGLSTSEFSILGNFLGVRLLGRWIVRELLTLAQPSIRDRSHASVAMKGNSKNAAIHPNVGHP